MLPSMRHYLRFVDLEKEFDARGFMHKVYSIKTNIATNLINCRPHSPVLPSNSSTVSRNAVSLIWVVSYNALLTNCSFFVDTDFSVLGPDRTTFNVVSVVLAILLWPSHMGSRVPTVQS